MKTFYITLVRELTGYCIKAVAENENEVREYAYDHYGKLWCSVYEQKPPEKVIGETLYLED